MANFSIFEDEFLNLDLATMRIAYRTKVGRVTKSTSSRDLNQWDGACARYDNGGSSACKRRLLSVT
jgi:hypothetical protein